ncbi:MAG: AraC family transcriptional regulator [Chthoniobacteraceae bacterium]
MPPTLEHAATETDLRTLIQEVLAQWLPRLHEVPIRIPKLHGLYRLEEQMHFHLRTELFVQLSGKTDFDFPEEHFQVGPGEICVVPRGMPHFERARAWKGPFHNLVFLCNGRSLRIHLARPSGIARIRPIIVIGTDVQATPTLSALPEELPEHDTQDRACLLGAYFTLVLAQMKGWTPPPEPEPYKIIHARQLVSEQLSNPALSVAELARQVQCSADYLSQIFRKATGLPLSAYINENRLQRARELLEVSMLNIAEVSQAAGFADPAYFSRIFRRWQGVTPREYREAHR